MGIPIKSAALAAHNTLGFYVSGGKAPKWPSFPLKGPAQLNIKPIFKIFVSWVAMAKEFIIQCQVTEVILYKSSNLVFGKLIQSAKFHSMVMEV